MAHILEKSEGPATLSTFYSRLIPRIHSPESGVSHKRLHETRSVPCGTSGCDLGASLQYIKTQWPLLWRQSEGLTPATMNRLRVEPKVVIQSKPEDKPVTYDIVARLLFVGGNHYTTEITSNGRSYLYNDLQHDGALKEKGKNDAAAFLEPFPESEETPVDMYFMARTSKTRVSSTLRCHLLICPLICRVALRALSELWPTLRPT